MGQSYPPTGSAALSRSYEETGQSMRNPITAQREHRAIL
jgi:hypothetical protein